MAYVKWSGSVLNTAASTTSLTLPASGSTAPTANDVILVFWALPYISTSTASFSSLGTSPPVLNGTGSTFTAVSPPDADNGTGTRFRTYRRTVVSGDAGGTISAPNPGTGNKALVAYVVGAVSLGTTGGIDGTPTKTTTNANSVTNATVTSTAAYSLFLTIGMIGATTTVTAPTSYHADQAVQSLATASLSLATAGGQAPAWSFGASAANSTGLLAIRGDGTAPPVTGTAKTSQFMPFFGGAGF